MRRLTRIGPCLALAAIAAGFGSTADAVPVDGVLDPAHGVALSVQTTQSSLGDYELFDGSELDAIHAFVANDTLWLFVVGGFSRFWSEPLLFPDHLQIFFDSRSGGQNPLSATNTSSDFHLDLQNLAGLTFDSEFVPDFWLGATRANFGLLHIAYSELPSIGGGAGYFLGEASEGGPGTLSGAGASNPFGILASFYVTAIAGVTGGCGPASGSGVTTGVEWAIPLAAIGSPTESIRIAALLTDGAYGDVISNQVLAPVPPGTCSLGTASGVDLGSIAGAQYVVVDLPTPVVRTTWGSVKARFR